MAGLSGRRRLPRIGLGGNKTPLTLGDPGAVNPDTLCSFQRITYPPFVFHRCSHTRTHTHTPCYFMVLTRGTVCPMLSSQWSICAPPQAVAVLQVPHCATASETHGQWCTVQDMMHEVKAQPLDHRARSAGLDTGEACHRTSHPPQLQVCSTWYGSGTAAPSGSHLPREGYGWEGPLGRVPGFGGGGGPGGAIWGGGGGGGGSAEFAPAMVWAGAWLGPTLPTFVPPFGRQGRKRAQVFRLRKPVVFGCWVAWVTDVAPVSVRAREVLTPSAVALCRSVTLPDGCPKPLRVCRACPVRTSRCPRVPCV